MNRRKCLYWWCLQTPVEFPLSFFFKVLRSPFGIWNTSESLDTIHWLAKAWKQYTLECQDQIKSIQAVWSVQRSSWQRKTFDKGPRSSELRSPIQGFASTWRPFENKEEKKGEKSIEWKLTEILLTTGVCKHHQILFWKFHQFWKRTDGGLVRGTFRGGLLGSTFL